MARWWASLVFLLATLATSGGVRAPNESGAPVVRHLLFVIVTDPHTPLVDAAAFGRERYEAVLRRTAIAIERETLNRLELRYSIVELPIGDAGVGYGERTFLEWYADLADVTKTERYDILAFGPDRRLPWCTDAHSLGVVIAGTTFTCLEAPTPTPIASNLLVHKIFHGFGFFHQHLRNKQYRLLDWEMGLPAYTELAEAPIADAEANAEVSGMAFFSQMALDAIQRGLRCARPSDRPEECRDVSGPFDRDVDGDGARDDVDGYPASPPGQRANGPDSDHDGIPDTLDLCPGTDVVVTGVQGGPMNYWSPAPAVDITATSSGKTLEVRWVAAALDDSKSLGDLMYFDDSREVTSTHLVLTRAMPVRARVAYAYRGQLVRRSFYVHGESSLTSPGPWAYFNEKEWYYFGRFGCDAPSELDLYDAASYDANADGLPDGLEIPADYDWDGDGAPDREDTLPTVWGRCSDAHVRGVKDSDGDGYCDPGYLVFKALPARVKRASYFGEIPTGMGNDPDFDRCPYLPGPDHGCPVRRDGKPWYADAYPFEPDR